MPKLIVIFFLFYMHSVFGQGSYLDQQCVTDEEYRLYTLINEYRSEKGLAKVPLSASLCLVAGAHAWDLHTNQPDKGKCNMHSWSDEGPWTACCYTEDHKKAECLWMKPSELTDYDGFGYEVSYYSSITALQHSDIARAALNGWKGSPGHNQIITNKNGWKRMTWQAMGVGIYGNYVVVWFGEKRDPAGKASLCP
ncbi:MAG TPA: CAP domain-containing protein [Bacteroidales bacterium]|nr:CAP domain-containing protein [Bacteroidales bacterium]